MRLFDSHCHIYLPEFDADREAVLSRMREKDMGAIVIGTNYEESTDALNLARQHDFLWASVGLHPNDNPEEEFDIARYRALAEDPKVVAIGECGLDFYRGDRAEVEERQRARFQKHIELALALKKPLIIHCRSSKNSVDAQEDMLEILSAYSHELADGRLKAVLHFFTSTKEVAEKYLALGCYLSFPCVITFTNMYDDAVRAAPLDRILSETDSPFAAPAIMRGKRNEPVYVEEAFKRLAELKGISVDGMGQKIVENSLSVFGLRGR